MIGVCVDPCGSGELVRLSPRSADARERDAVARLCADLRRGDETATARVLSELLPHVRRWCFRLLGPHPELEDAAQDALAEIAAGLDRFEGRSTLLSMARTVVTRTAYRYYGRRRAPWRREELHVEDAACEAPGPERELATRELVERVYTHLEALAPKRRTAIALCVLEGLSPGEAARIEGCSAVAMRSRLFEARAELDRRMAADAALAPLLKEVLR